MPRADVNLLRCEIGSEAYILNMAWVRSIERTDRASPIAEDSVAQASLEAEAASPGPRPMASLSVDGVGLPLYSLAEILGRSNGGTRTRRTDWLPEPQQRIVVLRPGAAGFPWDREPAGTPWGLVVDRVGQPFRIPAERVVPLPPVAADAHREVFEGVALLDDEMLLVLAPTWLTDPILPDGASPGALRRTAPAQAWAGASNERLAAAREEGTGGTNARRRLVNFALPGQAESDPPLSFGLSLSQVPEVLETLPVLKVPFAPGFVRGLVRWRDRAVPLIDLGERLGVACAPGAELREKTRLLIVYGGGQSAADGLCGFVVQADVRITPVPAARPAPSDSLPVGEGMARGVFETPQGNLVVLDVRAVLAPSSRAAHAHPGPAARG